MSSMPRLVDATLVSPPHVIHDPQHSRSVKAAPRPIRVVTPHVILVSQNVNAFVQDVNVCIDHPDIYIRFLTGCTEFAKKNSERKGS